MIGLSSQINRCLSAREWDVYWNIVYSLCLSLSLLHSDLFHSLSLCLTLPSTSSISLSPSTSEFLFLSTVNIASPFLSSHLSHLSLTRLPLLYSSSLLFSLSCIWRAVWSPPGGALWIMSPSSIFPGVGEVGLAAPQTQNPASLPRPRVKHSAWPGWRAYAAWTLAPSCSMMCTLALIFFFFEWGIWVVLGLCILRDKAGWKRGDSEAGGKRLTLTETLTYTHT